MLCSELSKSAPKIIKVGNLGTACMTIPKRENRALDLISSCRLLYPKTPLYLQAASRSCNALVPFPALKLQLGTGKKRLHDFIKSKTISIAKMFCIGTQFGSQSEASIPLPMSSYR